MLSSLPTRKALSCHRTYVLNLVKFRMLSRYVSWFIPSTVSSLSTMLTSQYYLLLFPHLKLWGNLQHSVHVPIFSVHITYLHLLFESLNIYFLSLPDESLEGLSICFFCPFMFLRIVSGMPVRCSDNS